MLSCNRSDIVPVCYNNTGMSDWQEMVVGSFLYPYVWSVFYVLVPETANRGLV